MTNLMHRGSQWLAGKLVQHAATPVTYRRGVVTAPLTATVGQTRYESHDQDGVITRSLVRDFLIDTAALVGSAIASLPKRGDQIEETVAGTTYVYEVANIGGEPPWRYSDPYRTKLRIHTRQINTRE